MGASDKATRGKVLPMRLPVYGYQSTEGSDTDISQAALPGDLINLIGISGTPSGNVEYIRFARPYQGQIERAYLTFNLSYHGSKEGGDQFQGVYFGRGVFNDGSTGDLSDRATVTTDQIKADHKMAFGQVAPFYPFYSNKQYVLNRLDITKLIANRGEPALAQQYRDYGFIIAVYFPGGVPVRLPSGVDGSGWPHRLWDFRVEASALFEV